MWKKILYNNAISILFIVLSGLSAVVTLFIKIDSHISIKWLILTLLVSLWFVLMMVTIVKELLIMKKIQFSTKLIKTIQKDSMYLITCSESLSYNTLISIYSNDGYEKLYAFGYVFNVQEDGILQVKVKKVFFDAEKDLKSKGLIFKNIVPLDILESSYEDI